MKKNSLNILIALGLALGWGTTNAQAARVEVWSAPYRESFYDEERMEIFLRPHERGYITVYRINAYGHVEILYPLAHQCQRELWGDRIYRLSELSAEAYFYDDEDSDPQIGVILTPEPVVLAPWLERNFVEAGLVIRTSPTIYARVDFPRIFARVEADIRIRLGSRCAPVFVVAPICAPPRPAREGRGPRHDADNRKRDHGRHEDPAPSWHAPDFPPEPGRRAFERRGPEMRRVNEPSRPPAGRQDRAASDAPQYKARGRNESPQPAKAGNEGNSNTRSRRERKASR